MQNPRGDVMSRLGGASYQSVRRLPTVEYVNRAGQQVDPLNGKPYSRPAIALSSSGSVNGTSNPRKRRRRGKICKLPCKTFGIMFGGLTPIPTNPTIDPPPRVCYNCWQPGHARLSCPRASAEKICNNCGRRGEDLSTCPRCRVAHAKYLAHLRGETLDQDDFDKLFPPNYKIEKNVERDPGYVRDGPLDEVLDHLLQPNEADYHSDHHEHHHERERSPYREPLVKYVETREYVRNPVSRQRRDSEIDEEERRRRRCDEYEYEERHRERERSYDRERSYEREDHSRERYRDREPSRDRSVERERRGNTSHDDHDSDPVQEVLQLTKSIAHLSPETQEMIMKQVMAERQEKARLRAVKYEVLNEDWP